MDSAHAADLYYVIYSSRTEEHVGGDDHETYKRGRGKWCEQWYQPYLLLDSNRSSVSDLGSDLVLCSSRLSRFFSAFSLLFSSLTCSFFIYHSRASNHCSLMRSLYPFFHSLKLFHLPQPHLYEGIVHLLLHGLHLLLLDLEQRVLNTTTSVSEPFSCCITSLSLRIVSELGWVMSFKNIDPKQIIQSVINDDEDCEVVDVLLPLTSPACIFFTSSFCPPEVSTASFINSRSVLV